MKKLCVIAVLIIIAVSVSLALLLKSDTLSSRLDDLQSIIDKYEPRFGSVPYGSQEYTDMITDYNKEIFAWAEKFEMQRYERDENNKILFDAANKPKVNPEFSGDVEKRFYSLNNRMTKMVLSSIPKKKRPDAEKQKNER